VLNASGRYVTHAILFDTGSDRLKEESAPAIQAVAKGLESDPALKLLIEGHTDSVGDAARNMDLSKRRADAVKGVMVAQFKIDAARLTTSGLGRHEADGVERHAAGTGGEPARRVRQAVVPHGGPARPHHPRQGRLPWPARYLRTGAAASSAACRR
jgi:OmpA-OmpF porin, OOP family